MLCGYGERLDSSLYFFEDQELKILVLWPELTILIFNYNNNFSLRAILETRKD